jgi:hypothetical protein
MPDSPVPASKAAPAPTGSENTTDAGASSTIPRGFRELLPEEYGRVSVVGGQSPKQRR